MTTTTNTGGLSALGFKIWLDRYALKDATKRSLKPGSLVVALVDPATEQRELGYCVSVDGGTVQVDLLPDGPDGVISETIAVPLDHVDVPLETSPAEMIARVARGIAAVEATDELREAWEDDFRWLLDDFRFVPGGRILAAAGTDQSLTFNNCFVLASPRDSREGIIDTLRQMTEIMSRGGGVGINVSSLRPRKSVVRGVNGHSSGAVSWGALYSFVTGLIEQGGSRRGALMLQLADWHPDVAEFINAKREAGKIVNANISVRISDAFMRAVLGDLDWQLVFPNTSDPLYDDLWDGDLDAWIGRGGGVIVHKTIKARALWNQIVESAWASAEPGVVFIDTVERQSNSQYYAPTVGSNPCSEQFLPAYGVCTLGAINLAKFVVTEPGRNPEVNWSALGWAVYSAARFLDNVIDATPYPIPETEVQQKRERRIGLGTLGLGEMLIRLGLRYGSDSSITFVDRLFHFIATEAYEASIGIAQEKGAFPAFDADGFLASGFVDGLPGTVRARIRACGIRNVTLLTQAPTGTTGTMVNTSTGIEPFYAWTYLRKSRMGVHEETVAVYDEWLTRRFAEGSADLPDEFVTAQELRPEEHVLVQAAVQRWIDSAISKTANLPADYTVEDTDKLYRLMWELGCKGGTVYRDGSRDEQVLMLKENEAGDADRAERDDDRPAGLVLPAARDVAPALPADLTARRHRFHVGDANGYVITSEHEGRVVEVFLPSAKSGSTVQGLLSALAVTLSTALQHGVPLAALTRRLRGMTFEPAGFTDNPEIRSATSVVDYIARYLDGVAAVAEADHYEWVDAPPGEEDDDTTGPIVIDERAPFLAWSLGYDLCDSCGVPLVHEDGCATCRSCGFARCA
jgi:ribonucleoside-diphosphate reductase alpha chain